MTNCNILEELGECIKSAKPSCRFSQKQLMTYFLGEKLEEEIRKQKKQNYSHAKEMEENGLGERFLRMLYKGERQTLAPARLIKLATSEDWTLERLTDNEPLFIKEEKEHLEKCIRELYFRHLPDANGNLELGDMVCSLVRLHFFGTEAIEDLLIPYNPQKFTPCIHYIPWDEKEEELQRLLEQEPNFPVFITGLPASGKKQMVKHYISSNFNGTDIFWLDHYPDLSLEEQLSNIQFLCEETDKPSNTEKIIQFLQYKTSSSLLIITISLMESDDCRLIEQYLGDIDLKIIIITRTTDLPTSYKVVNMDNRPVENLKRLFDAHAAEYNCTSEKYFSMEAFSELCKITSYSPFFMEMLSKVLLSGKLNKEAINTMLDIHSWHMDCKSYPKVHSGYYHDGPKAQLSLKTITEDILMHYKNKEHDFIKTKGSLLSILAKNEIPESLLLDDNDISPSDIQTAINLGIMHYTDTDNSLLQMPSIIADIIWQKYPLSYKNYKEYIFKFLNKLSFRQIRLMPYDTLSDHVLTTVYRFHFQLTKTNTKGSPKKKSFTEWNQMLSDLVLYFIRLGNINAAQCLLSRLYIYENNNGLHNDLSYIPQYMERDIFQLHINFAKRENPLLVLNNAIEIIKKRKEEYDSSAKGAHYILLFQRIYSFIMYTLDEALLIRLSISEGEMPEVFQKLTNNLLKTLSSIFNNLTIKVPSLIKTSSNGKSEILKNRDLTIIEYPVLSYYRMLSAYLSEDAKNAEIYFNNIDEGSNIQVRARICKLYYTIEPLVKKFEQSRSSISTEQIESYIAEYYQLYHKVHDRITSYHTMRLFYYCSMLMCFLLPANHPEISHINAAWSDTCNAMIALPFLSDTEKECITKTYEEVLYYSEKDRC